jgi:hypothetical protein
MAHPVIAPEAQLANSVVGIPSWLSSTGDLEVISRREGLPVRRSVQARSSSSRMTAVMTHLGPLALGCEGAELRQQSGCSLVHVMQTAQHWP